MIIYKIFSIKAIHWKQTSYILGVINSYYGFVFISKAKAKNRSLKGLAGGGRNVREKKKNTEERKVRTIKICFPVFLDLSGERKSDIITCCSGRQK